MKLAVCGDSFSATSDRSPNTHWSELLSQKLGWSLKNYARRGCSNGAIRLQIDQAIKEKCDFVFVVPTSWDRIDIPCSGVEYPANEKSQGWINQLQQFLLDKNNYRSYDRTMGLGNMNYHKDQNSGLISETLFSLAENFNHEYRSGKLNPQTHAAIKGYLNHLYDSAWKQQMDQWIITQGLVSLHDRTIKFSVEKGMLWETQQQFEQDMPALVERHSIRTAQETLAEGCHRYPLKDVSKDPGYHSEVEAQQWLADLSLMIIKDKFKL